MYLNYITCRFCCNTFYNAALVETGINSRYRLPIYPTGTQLSGGLLPGKRSGTLLPQQNKLTGCITVKLWCSNFCSNTQQHPLPYTDDGTILLKTVKERFNKLFERRILIGLAGVRFMDFIPGSYRINLFDDKQEKIKLYRAINSIKNRFGERYMAALWGVAKKNSSRISSRNNKQKIIKL
jgi:hypothetical protein